MKFSAFSSYENEDTGKFSTLYQCNFKNWQNEIQERGSDDDKERFGNFICQIWKILTFVNVA